MTPEQFIAKWKAVELKERSAAQSHFIDLCRMLDEPAPTDVDPTGDWYAFERGASKTTGGEGWADVWKRGHFGWEYKGKRKDLNAAFAQLQQYALALENPPLLVVCDMDRFRIHTNWTNSISEVHEFNRDGLRDATIRQQLKWVFSDPDRLKPGKTRQALTEQAAAEFSKLAQRLRERGHKSEVVAHFINRLVFCMFAEDVDLLPNKMFKRLLDQAKAEPEEFETLAGDLFRAMKAGGRIGFEHVAWFNGGLFNDDAALPLDKDDVALTMRAADLDWAEIDPSILGTLFERGLDPDKRSQLGAHYTDRDKIMLIVNPVIVQPWLAEWETTKAEIARHMSAVMEARERRPTKQSDARKVHASARRAEEAALKAATAAYIGFLDRLRRFRVLDPACGSGNFLYLALTALKNIEHRANIEAELLGMTRQAPAVGPESVRGIEINPYAAELARISVWIGEIQWMRRNGFGISRDPILRPLETIECRDAILNADDTEATWPDADVAIGNPPFLGGKWMLDTLGATYTSTLRRVYLNRVPPTADLVTYWFEKARQLVKDNQLGAAGFVATNMIRSASNRPVMDAVVRDVTVFDAWSDEPWTVDGADVRVSLVCFSRSAASGAVLNGIKVSKIFSDVSSGTMDITKALSLSENGHKAIRGIERGGPFDVPGEQAREWLLMPLNPNGRPNADVLRPMVSGIDLARRPLDKWVIDFASVSEGEAALYEAVFAYAAASIRPVRAANREARTAANWWHHRRTGSDLRYAIAPLERYLATGLVSKHRLFSWFHRSVLPDTRLVVIARDDDVTFGVLSSAFHEWWTLRACQYHGVGNDPIYTPGSTFETFPFPEGLSPNVAASCYANNPRAVKIADAAKRLNELREAWLNPPDLVKRVPEVVPGFPDRVLPVDDKAAAVLKKRTLTNLYNERPAWLANAHHDLDAAVAAAYGWPVGISEEDALARLFALNQLRAMAAGEGA